MASIRSDRCAAMLLFVVGFLGSIAQAQTPSFTTAASPTGNFASGVTPPPNQPLPSFNCPSPTQAYCYWEPNITKDKYYTCWRSWINYVSASNSVQFISTRSWTKTHTITNTTQYIYSTIWDADVSFSTLCDGHPRAPSDATPTEVTSTTVVPLTTTRTSWEIDPASDYLPWPTPPPCEIPEKPCASLSSAWNSMSAGFSGGWYHPNIPLGLWQAPHCSVDYAKYYPSPCLPPASRSGCFVVPDDLTMLYWPVTTVSGNLCSQDGTTITAEPTKPGQPNTVVYEGNTLTSPSVYMVVGTARGFQTTLQPHSQSFWCDSTVYDITMTMKPEDVTKSFWHNGNQLQTARFNFNDLNTLPYPAYSDEVCGWGLFRNSVKDDCKTVWGGYHPTVSVPASVTQASAGWESCDVVQLATVARFVPLAPVPEVPDGGGRGSGVPRAVDAMPTGV